MICSFQSASKLKLNRVPAYYFCSVQFNFIKNDQDLAKDPPRIPDTPLLESSLCSFILGQHFITRPNLYTCGKRIEEPLKFICTMHTPPRISTLFKYRKTIKANVFVNWFFWGTRGVCILYRWSRKEKHSERFALYKCGYAIWYCLMVANAGRKPEAIDASRASRF